MVLKNLASGSAQDRLAANQELQKEREVIIARLIAMIQRKEQYEVFDSVALAIEALGRMRATEAIEALVRHIDIAFPVVELEVLREEEHHLAAVALVHIGYAAVPALIGNIQTQTEDVARRLSVWVIREIVGADLARVILERSRATATDAAAIKHINQALEYLEQG